MHRDTYPLHFLFDWIVVRLASDAVWHALTYKIKLFCLNPFHCRRVFRSVTATSFIFEKLSILQRKNGLTYCQFAGLETECCMKFIKANFLPKRFVERMNRSRSVLAFHDLRGLQLFPLISFPAPCSLIRTHTFHIRWHERRPLSHPHGPSLFKALTRHNHLNLA